MLTSPAPSPTLTQPPVTREPRVGDVMVFVDVALAIASVAVFGESDAVALATTQLIE